MKTALLIILALSFSSQVFAEDPLALPATGNAQAEVKKEKIKKPKSAFRLAAEKRIATKAKEYAILIAVKELNAILTSTDDAKLNPVSREIKKRLNSANLENTKEVIEALKEVVGDNTDKKLDLVSKQIDRILTLVTSAEEDDPSKLTEADSTRSSLEYQACSKYIFDRGIRKNGDFFTQMSSDEKSLRNYTEKGFNECDSNRVTCFSFTGPKKVPTQHASSQMQFSYYSSHNKESLLKNVFGKDHSENGVKNPPIAYENIVSRDRCVKLLLDQEITVSGSEGTEPAKTGQPGSSSSGG